MGKYIIEFNEILPVPEITVSCSHLGIFQNEGPDRPEFYENYELWRYESVNKAGVSVERVFLPIPSAPPSKTPYHKVENAYIFNAHSNKDAWDTNSFNVNFWNGSLIWYLKTCRAYGIIPIFDISGYSTCQMIAPGVISERFYPIWKKILDKLIPICQIYLGNKFFISPGNELGQMHGPKATGAKRIIGAYFYHILNYIKDHGLSLHNILANVSSGYNWNEGKYTNVNTQDSAILTMTGESDLKTGRPTHIKPGPGRPFIFAVHGVGSLNHFVGYIGQTLDKKTGKYIKHYMSKFAKKSPTHTAFMLDFDGVDMDGVGMIGENAYNTIVDIQKYGEKKAPRLLIAGCHPRNIYYTMEDMPAILKQKQYRKQREAWSGVNINGAKVSDYVLPARMAYKYCHKKEPKNYGKYELMEIWKMFMPEKPEPIPDIPDEEIEIISESEINNIILDEEKEEKMEYSFLEKVKRALGIFSIWIEKQYVKVPFIRVLSFIALLYVLIRLLIWIL